MKYTYNFVCSICQLSKKFDTYAEFQLFCKQHLHTEEELNEINKFYAAQSDFRSLPNVIKIKNNEAYNPWTFSFWDEGDNIGIKLGPLSICGYSNKFYGFGFEIHWMNKSLLQIGDLFT